MNPSSKITRRLKPNRKVPEEELSIITQKPLAGQGSRARLSRNLNTTEKADRAEKRRGIRFDAKCNRNATEKNMQCDAAIEVQTTYQDNIPDSLPAKYSADSLPRP